MDAAIGEPMLCAAKARTPTVKAAALQGAIGAKLTSGDAYEDLPFPVAGFATLIAVGADDESPPSPRMEAPSSPARDREAASPQTMTEASRAASTGEKLTTSGRMTRFGTKKIASHLEMIAQPGLAAVAIPCAMAGAVAWRPHKEVKRKSMPASDEGNGIAFAAKSRRRAMSTAMMPPSEPTPCTRRVRLDFHAGGGGSFADNANAAR
mmetsp:Transcript_22769/g.56611  ORF Transcript_22769/g.56611 Transcript_22769/m.56611 type:complete len:208 (-) Transcript_22769:154-777(-)